MKLISINIEGNKHLDLVIPFIKKENPDVLCVQEVIETTIPQLEKEFGMKAVYARMAYDLITHEGGLACVALFSKYELTATDICYYVGSDTTVTNVVHSSNPDDLHTFVQNAVVFGTVTIDGRNYTIATTHGTWTPEGLSTDYQKNDFEKMIAILEAHKPFVLAGDFNAPRGRESFALLADRYKDCIPAEYTNSLDMTLHRAKHLNLEYMVDGLFTTPEYEAQNVHLVDKVSDHMAIVAEIV